MENCSVFRLTDNSVQRGEPLNTENIYSLWRLTLLLMTVKEPVFVAHTNFVANLETVNYFGIHCVYCIAIEARG